MARRCGTRNGRCPKPRANWWKKALGVDWFNHNSGGSDPSPEDTLQLEDDSFFELEDTGYIELE